MSRQRFEVGDIIRAYGHEFLSGHSVVPQVKKTFTNLANCHTSVLGGHIEVCPDCGEVHVSYNSCRDRHCPKCQQKNREQWIEARREEVMPVKYFHVVFTIPDCLHPIAMHNQPIFYGSIFRAAWSTINTFARNEGVQTGMISILHTWSPISSTILTFTASYREVVLMRMVYGTTSRVAGTKANLCSLYKL